MNTHPLYNNDIKHALFYVLSVTLSTIVLISLMSGYYQVSFRDLTADPNVIANQPFYIGLLSQLGLFFWSAAATLSFSFAFFSKRLVKDKVLTSFYIFSGVIVSLLMIDDCFMLHEDVLPGLGIPQKVVFLFYGVLVLIYLIKFREIILKTPFILLLFAFGGFSLSALIDLFFHFETSNIWDSFIEDGAKFTGIVFWVSYVFQTNKLIFKR
jgi:hypothetical protein